MNGGTSADVVVVGGGLVGISVAYELASAGADVALVDASHPGRASDAGAGIVSPETFHDPDRDWFEFGMSAARHMRSLVARLAEDGAAPGPEAFAECGSLVVAQAEHEDPWFDEVLTVLRTRTPTPAEIPVGDARAMFPPLGPLWRALHSPTAARVDGRSLCASLRSAAQRRGVTLLSMEATGVDRRGDTVTAVRGTSGVVACGTLVLAGGAWSADAGRWLDVDLPVTPTKGQIVHVVLPGAGATRPGATGAGTADSGRWPIVQPILNFYLVPWPGGRVACGGTFEADAGFDTRPTAAGVRDLLRECVAIAPGLADATFSEVRVGLRPVSADDRPVLGPLPGFTNVHVCTGHGANGLLLGPYSAALVAAGIAGAPATATPYSPSRFSTP
ncbi:MAG TPA: FAD-dependent oxidoreductase [Acidimicrobiales bacterium]|nr:FAD-dependent oxidoreductase [Acidimicrobiales bacterium]